MSSINKLLFVTFCTLSSSSSFLANASIHDIDFNLNKSHEYIHYEEAYIRGPGVIDLTHLEFNVVHDNDTDNNSHQRILQEEQEQEQEQYGEQSEQLQQQQQPQQQQGEENETTNGSYEIDVVVFPLEKGCTRDNCDWAEHGVGKRGINDEFRWCCNEDAVSLGLCSTIDYGQLLVDGTRFEGQHIQLTVPKDDSVSMQQINEQEGKILQDQSGTYVVLYANCDTNGKNVHVSGQTVWKSKHGYLPGDLYGYMLFYIVLTVVYATLYMWYDNLRRTYKNWSVEIEHWVAMAIALGLMEMLCRSLEYHMWNRLGHRSTFCFWMAVLFGGLKHGLSRIVMVMVSYGWGVVRCGSTMGDFRYKVVSLGINYALLCIAQDSAAAYALHKVNTLSYYDDTKSNVYEMEEILKFVQGLINVVFIIWIIDCLDKTMNYLRDRSDFRKLRRMFHLRMIFLTFVFLSVMWALLAYTTRAKRKQQDDSILAQEEHAWLMDAASEFNYLFLLIAIAILWRPNADAKMYAFVEDELHEDDKFLKLPSALNDDYDDVDALEIEL